MHDERPPRAVSVADAQIIEQALAAQRRFVVAAALVNLLASVFILFLLGSSSIPPTLLDYVAQGLIILALTSLLAWILLGTESSYRGPIVLVGLLVATLVMLRLFAAAFGHGWDVGLADVLPPLLGYSPAAIVFFFAVFPLRLAHHFAQGFILITGALMMVYLLFHGAHLAQSARMAEAAQEFLFVNPIIYLVMIIAMEVQSRLRERRATVPAMSVAQETVSRADLDPGTSLYNWSGLRRVLGQEMASSPELFQDAAVALVAVGALREAHRGQADHARMLEREFIARTFVAQLRDAAGATAILCRLSTSRLVVVWRGQLLVEVLDQVTDFVDAYNGATDSPRDRIAVGLVSWHPGHTITSTLQRCEEQLKAAQGEGQLGVGFDPADAAHAV